MAYSCRDFVSQVRGMSKLLSTDSLINDRTIIREGKNVGLKLVKQAMDQRKLWRSPYLFAPIPCLELEETPLSECCEYTSDVKISRSKKKLPQIAEGNWGLAIQGVFGLDGRKKFKETNPNRYANLLKLNPRSKDIYFWIQNNYLYVSSPDVKAVNMFAFFREEIPNDLLYPGEECECKTPPSIENLCVSELDKPFYFPGEKINDIVEIVYTHLLKTYFPVKQDVTSDNVEDTAKP